MPYSLISWVVMDSLVLVCYVLYGKAWVDCEIFGSAEKGCGHSV